MEFLRKYGRAIFKRGGDVSLDSHADQTETIATEALKDARFKSRIFRTFLIKAQVRETRNRASI